VSKLMGEWQPSPTDCCQMHCCPLCVDDPREPEIVPVVIADMQRIYDDDDIVVVSKPPFLAAHPSLAWEGDTVLVL